MRHAGIGVATLLFALPAFAQETATFSFSENHTGTFPRSITGDETIKVDLTRLPVDTTVFRAVLRPGRHESEARRLRDVPVKVVVEGGDTTLRLLPPRLGAFDVSAEVQAALKAGSQSISFTFIHFPGYEPPFNRLDISATGKPRKELPRVSGLTATHRAGQTILTWMEPALKDSAERMSFQEFSVLRESIAREPHATIYRIYRSAEPITAATIAKAELVDEIGPLSGWDPEYYGTGIHKEQMVPRYVVHDEGNPVAPGTAIYAHNPKAAGKAYYAVGLVQHGEEDLTLFDRGNAVAEPVDESVGPGSPVLQRVEHPEEFNYVRNAKLMYYVRWECPPSAHMPSRPIDYLVALPPKRIEPAPVGLHLHCWGGSLDGGYGWWYDAAQGAMLISTNEIPYDWWTGYHECSDTWKSWREGVVRDYTQTRLMSFLDWAATQWKIDPARVFTAGNSMGGSGSSSLALRRADRVAWCVSWVGVHRPADSPQFVSSYELVYGDEAWKLLFQDRKTPAFEYFDDVAFLRANPARELPLLVFANGKNDRAIGWAQAHAFWKALQETKRPHVFRWGQAGHGQRALLPGPMPGERELGIDVRLDQTLPAFSRCSLDNDAGDGDPERGSAEGQSNLYLLWDTAADQVVDQVGRWGLTLRLNLAAPAETCKVDVTPRRCFQFRTPAGSKAKWRTLTPEGRELQAGEAASDKAGLLTLSAVLVTKSGTRLVVETVR